MQSATTKVFFALCNFSVLHSVAFFLLSIAPWPFLPSASSKNQPSDFPKGCYFMSEPATLPNPLFNTPTWASSSVLLFFTKQNLVSAALFSPVQIIFCYKKRVKTKILWPNSGFSIKNLCGNAIFCLRKTFGSTIVHFFGHKMRKNRGNHFQRPWNLHKFPIFLILRNWLEISHKIRIRTNSWLRWQFVLCVLGIMTIGRKVMTFLISLGAPWIIQLFALFLQWFKGTLGEFLGVLIFETFWREIML